MSQIAEYNNPVAGNISELIESLGFKQKAIAEKAGMTPQVLTEILNGRRILKMCEVQPIANALGVGVDALFMKEAPYDIDS